MHWNNFEKGGGLNRDDEVKNALTVSSFSHSLSLFLSQPLFLSFTFFLFLSFLTFLSLFLISLSPHPHIYHVFSLILKLYSFLLCSSTLIIHSPDHTNSRAHPNTNTRTHSHSQTSVHTLTLIFPLSALYLPSKPLTPYPAQPSFILQCFKSVFFHTFVHFSFHSIFLSLLFSSL